MTKKIKSNQTVETAFEERVKTSQIRVNKLIDSYKFDIAVSKTKNLTGELTRTEMELLHRLYTSEGANLQSKSIAREFTQYTLQDVKRILRAFAITKASCALAPHQLEEMTTDEASAYALRLKEKTFIKKFEEDKIKYNDLKVKELFKQVNGLQEELNSSSTLLSGIQFNKLPIFKVKPPKDKGVDIVLYVSDVHIGAEVNNEGVYTNVYSEEIAAGRLNKLVQLAGTFSNLKSITVFNLGDGIDGFDRRTTRPQHNHDLPQNMSNREQVRSYINVMYNLFKSLGQFKVPMKFISVCESNHGGDGEYAATLALNALLEHSGVKTIIASRPIEHVVVNGTTFIYLHGKDNQNMFKNFPLTVDQRVENFFNEYIMRHEIKGKIVVVKGDLHQSATTKSKFFDYKSVGSLFGASNWIHANFGKTEWSCDYSIFQNGMRLDGVINETF